MANLRRYTLPLVLAIIAVAVLVVGVLSLTVWKPQQEVVAERSTEHPYTMTREGVLPLYADEVVISATAEDNRRVWLAVGASNDVKAWLQSESYDEIIGLATLTDLKAVPHISDTDQQDTGETSSEDTPKKGENENPLQSDMWTAIKYGTGSVTLTLSGEELSNSVLAATDGVGPAPTISLTWQTPQPNILGVVSFVFGVVVFLLALVTWLVLVLARKRRLARSAELRSPDRHDAIETTMLDVVAPNEPEREVVEDTSQFAPKEEPTFDDVAADTPHAPHPPETVDAAETADTPETVDAADTTDANDEEEHKKHQTTPSSNEVDKPFEAEQLETVTTDSGMLNLAALRDGGAFPTRRALREAQSRGVDALVVEGRKFSTDRPDISEKTGNTEDATPEDVLKKRSMSGLTWTGLMDVTASDREDDEN